MREWLRRWRARRATSDTVDLPFQAALERVDVGMAHIDPDSRILHVNGRLPELLEYTEAELLAKRFRSLLHPEEVPAYVEATDALADARSESFGIETRMVTKSGETLYVRLTGSVVRHADATPKLAILIVEDLTERIRWETQLEKKAAELAASEARYRLLFESNPMPMWVYDRATLHFLSVNEATVRQYGYSREEFMTMTLLDIRPPEDAARLRLAVIEQQDLKRSAGWRHVRKDGTVIDVEIVAYTVKFGDYDAELVLAQDVTERKRVEAQLRQAQKMEGIGQLAGGIAHDFNNMLTAIVSYSDLIIEAGHGDIQEDVHEIRRAADRAAALTRQLLAFSRQQVVRMEVLSINDVVTHMEKFLARIVREDIRFEVALEKEPGLIEADPGQVEQVIMNLVVNARDAMPKGGTVSIRTTMEVRDDKRFSVLTVSDSGNGIPAELKDRIFEPFYTTKDVASGTGLGLAIVHGIVEQAGGRIEVESEPGVGASFRILFPIARERRPQAAETIRETHVPRGREVVLLVEDDNAVRAVTVRILRKQGYSVLEASSGADALEKFARHSGEIQLVITDMVMPGMSGPELVTRMRAQSQELPILFVSGYSKDAAGQLAQFGMTDYLEKPFTPVSLATAVRRLLDAAPPST